MGSYDPQCPRSAWTLHSIAFETLNHLNLSFPLSNYYLDGNEPANDKCLARKARDKNVFT